MIGCKALCCHRQKFLRNVLVDEQAFRRIAYARALALGVDENILRHLKVGSRINVNVAVARAGLDDGHGRVHDNRADQSCAAARNQHIEIAVQLHHLGCGVAAGVLHQIDGVLRQTLGCQRCAHQLCQAHGGLECLLAAAQDARRAGLEAQHSRIHGDIRASLVDNADHAHRHALLTDVQAVRTLVHPKHLTDRVGQRRHLTAAFGNARNALFVQHQTVDQAVVQTCRSAVFNINPVCRDDLVRMCHQRVRNGENAAVFVVRAELRHRILGAAGILGDLHERSHYIFTS